ncbi:hypothetical protein BWI17_22480 [Betaproteobacteria bacterium GR16-43]|nr:hypothetical protein BWI17_22480 [Betaproteobacteria bacterium GR16-43]
MEYQAGKRNVAGMGLVLALHLLVVYALVNGLGRIIVDKFKPPVDISMVPDAPKPPPPEPQVLPTKLAPAPTIVVAVQPIVIQPSVDTIMPPADEVAAPAPSSFGTGTSSDSGSAKGPSAPVRREFKAAYRVEPIYPRAAQRNGTDGRVIAHVHVAPNGVVSDVRIVWSSHRVFEREVIRALSQWRFNPEPVGFVGEYEIAFNLKD